MESDFAWGTQEEESEVRPVHIACGHMEPTLSTQGGAKELAADDDDGASGASSQVSALIVVLLLLLVLYLSLTHTACNMYICTQGSADEDEDNDDDDADRPSPEVSTLLV